jgi:hypothetical protein
MKFLLPVLALSCAFFACKKDEEPTNTDKISSKPWYFESGGADFNADGTVDFPLASVPGVQACNLDNFATFKSDGTGITDEGGSKCSTTAPQTTNFSWGFASNETILNVSGSAFAGIGGQFKVKTLTDNNLTLTKDTTITGAGSGTLIFSLKH